MNAWATRRKIIYVSSAAVILFLIILIPTLFLLHSKPTCFDGKQNGSETGVDCGGECQLLCSTDTVDPTILWSRAFKVTNGVYSALAYIENPNLNSEAQAKYVFTLYDANNAVIGTRENTILIPKNKVLAIFEPNIDTQGKTPSRVTFAFTNKLVWQRNIKTPPNISVTQKILSGETDKPRIDATVENQSLEPVSRVELTAIVYDNKENAIAASRTYVDGLDTSAAAHVTFTWPLPFMTTKEVCRVPVEGTVGTRPEALGVMLAIDRSGSMASISKNPPQPLTDVKNAVISFIQQFKGTDQVGVVSFANIASNPPDAVLSQKYESVITATRNIAISGSGVQYTNIADGIDQSFAQLATSTQSALTKKVIVLLTDGVANLPEKAGDKNYPENFAKIEADVAKKAGAEIFTIGLGDKVNGTFLSNIATAPDHYFVASTTKDLADIYNKIAVSFCTTGPSVVEIIPRVVPAI